MYELWLRSHLDTPLTEQRIADQALSLLCRKTFTELELDGIRRGAQGKQTSGAEETCGTLAIPTNQPAPPTQVSYNVSVCDATSLNVHQTALKDKIESVYLADKPRSRLPRLVWNKKLKEILLDANETVKCINTINITETCSLLYATAVVVTDTLGYRVSGTRQAMCRNCCPPWEHRLSRKIEFLHSDLSRLEEVRTGRLQQDKLRSSLFVKYNIPQKSIKEVIECLKQQI